MSNSPASTSRFHRARLGGTTTGQLQSSVNLTFPPSPPRWDDNWPATVRRQPHVSTEPASVGRQLASYSPASTSRFHRARLGGTTTGQLQSSVNLTFPPSPPRWDDNWPATVRRQPHVSTEPASVGRQLASYSPASTSRFHRARLGGTTTGQLQSSVNLTFPPSPPRWDDNWPATVQRQPHVSTEPAFFPSYHWTPTSARNDLNSPRKSNTIWPLA